MQLLCLAEFERTSPSDTEAFEAAVNLASSGDSREFGEDRVQGLRLGELFLHSVSTAQSNSIQRAAESRSVPSTAGHSFSKSVACWSPRFSRASIRCCASGHVSAF